MDRLDESTLVGVSTRLESYTNAILRCLANSSISNALLYLNSLIKELPADPVNHEMDRME
jgi:hypothetical protein